MSKFIKIFLGVIAVIILAIMAVFYFTAGIVDVGDEFFIAVKSGDIDNAYTFLSEDFKANTSKNELREFLSKSGLANFKESSWANRSISGARGELKGSITTESGGVVPLTLGFVKGEDGWKIYSIRKPSSGIQEETVSLDIPSEEEQVKLVDGAMQVFAESVNDKSMKKFYTYISNLWQKQITVEKLDEIFRAFYDAGVDLTVLNNFSPVFEQKAAIADNGVLLLKGLYPTDTDNVYFEQKYILEGISWKLVGFKIDIK